MGKSLWIIIAALSLLVAAFFGFQNLKDSKSADAERAAKTAMQQELEQVRLKEKEASRRADLEAEARRMGELKAKQDAEAEARRLAQAQAERDDREAARAHAEGDAAKAQADLEKAKADKARLETESRRLAELRAKDAAEAQQKLKEAQRALSETEKSKNAEIERQAALLASYGRQSANLVQTAKADDKSNAEADRFRIIYPIDYKRASHYNLPLLTSPNNSTTSP